MKHNIRFKVNGDECSLAVDPWRTLNEVLREDLNLTGTKFGCGVGDCGACAVMVDGRTVSSCLTLAVSVDGKDIQNRGGTGAFGRRAAPDARCFCQTGGDSMRFLHRGYGNGCGASLEPQSVSQRERN